MLLRIAAKIVSLLEDKPYGDVRHYGENEEARPSPKPRTHGVTLRDRLLCLLHGHDTTISMSPDRAESSPCARCDHPGTVYTPLGRFVKGSRQDLNDRRV
jgi:hypothetical protein